MNRHQRRRFSTLHRRSRLESVPRAANEANVRPCDWPGCQEPWMFSTHATMQGLRKVVALRCTEHRLFQNPA